MKHNSATEYLQRATRGLRGRRRREVREELEVHLSERVTAHRIGGLTEAEAVERALTELGSPQEVSVGMTRLYTLPTVMGSGAVLAAVCVLVVALWPKGAAQTLQGTFYWPSPECMDAVAKSKPLAEQRSCHSDEFWVAQETLEQVLEPQGVMFKRVSGSGAEVLSVTVPGTTPFFIEPTTPVPGPSDGLDVEEWATRLLYKQDALAKAPAYLPFWEFIKRSAINSDTNLKIGGWDNPTFQLNEVSFQLYNKNRLVKGSEFYGSYLNAVLHRALIPNLSQEYDSISVFKLEDFVFPNPSKVAKKEPLPQQALLRVDGERSDVYGVITYLESQNESTDQPFESSNLKDATFWMQLGRVAEQGDVRARFPQGAITFVESFGYGDDLKPGSSILVRLAGGDRRGGGWYEVVSPERVTLEPTS